MRVHDTFFIIFFLLKRENGRLGPPTLDNWTESHITGRESISDILCKEELGGSTATGGVCCPLLACALRKLRA